MSTDNLNYAVQLVKSGNKQGALPILKEIVQDDPNNENAWLWLYSCSDRTEQKRYCLQQALRINPNNQNARKALDNLERLSSSPNPATPATSRPTSLPDETANINQKAKRAASIPAKQPKSNNLSFGKIIKTIAWGTGALIIGSFVLSFLFSDSQTQGEMSMQMIFGFYAIWAGMGYYGAWKLIKKGHGLNLAGCAILAGGAPILLPLVLGPIMYFWGRSAKDKNAMPNGYVICPKCQKPTLLNSAFCANCGNEMQLQQNR
jgi:tetratricopeptide (TPR) repeat protein